MAKKYFGDKEELLLTGDDEQEARIFIAMTDKRATVALLLEIKSKYATDEEYSDPKKFGALTMSEVIHRVWNEGYEDQGNSELISRVEK